VPELPEVETVRRQLAPRLAGRVVVAAGAHPSPKFATAVDALGRRIAGLGRRGKYLIAELDDDLDLVVHLGMTGVLSLAPGTAPAPPPHLRAWWALAGEDEPDGSAVLTFTDIRRFGRTVVVPRDDHGALPTLQRLGPEPLGDDFTVEHLAAALRRGDAPLKALLLGQRVVAGVGNIYCDEACWRAGVHPGTRTVPASRVAALHAAIREVLAEGIAHGGTTLRDYRDGEGASGSHQQHLDCYGRAGEPCNRCGTTLERSVVAARGTTTCPSCQPRRALRPRRVRRPGYSTPTR
jgi:formamidopyrimidine-DNA glycosylase